MKYYSPETLQDYLELRRLLSADVVTVLAGGTDLLPRYEQGLSLPDHLIDLKHLSDMRGVQVTDDSVHIGVLTTIQEIHDDPVISREYRALHEAAHAFAGAQIRHRGTLGGNICNASPAGDMLPGLYVFEARVTLKGPEGSRDLPVADFITGPGKTALRPGEVLTDIILPRRQQVSTFQKVGLRQSMAISVINLAISYQGSVPEFTTLKMAAGAVAPTVVTLDDFTAAYLKTGDFRACEKFIDTTIAPIDDIRATADYRRRVLKNLVRDFLKA